jgi:hypothetical protein
MDSKSTSQNEVWMRRTNKHGLLLLGFLMIFAWFGIRLAIMESPAEWKDANITVTDVRHISRKPNCWQITDTEGNTYSAYESNRVVEKIIPQCTYYIVYSPDNHNAIRAITYDDTIIVDYAQSISVYCERNIWEWLLAFLGLTGTMTIVVRMLIDIHKKIPRKKMDSTG